MRVQLRCSVPVHRSRTIVLETRCNPFARCFGRMVSADPSLNVFFHFAKRYLHTFPMRPSYAIVSTDKSSQRDALRSRERRVPGGTMLHGANRLTSCIDVFARCLMANELLFGQGMLTVRQPLKVFLLHFTMQPPLLREPAVPLAAYSVALGVVVLLRVCKLLFVIRLRLAGTQRFGNGQHDSLEVGFLPGRDATGVLRLARRQLLRGRSFRLRRPFADIHHPRWDLPWAETGLRLYGSKIWKAERHYQIVDFKQCVQAL